MESPVYYDIFGCNKKVKTYLLLKFFISHYIKEMCAVNVRKNTHLVNKKTYQKYV